MTVASPLFTVEFYREHAKVIFDKGREKTVTIQDCLNTINAHAGVFTDTEEVKDFSLFQASKSFLGSLSSNKGKEVLVYLYKESTRNDIMFDLRKISVKEYFDEVLGVSCSSREGKEMLGKLGIKIDGNFIIFPNCLMPNFIIQMTLNLSNDKKTYGIGNVMYGMTDSPRELAKIDKSTTDMKRVLNVIGSRPPFPNFYDTRGMCYGSNSPLVTINNDNNFRPLESYANLIAQSAFNFDLLPRVMPARFRTKDFFTKVTGKPASEAPRRAAADHIYNCFVNFMLYLTTATEFPYEDFKRESY